MIKIINADMKYLEEAVKLAVQEYKEELQQCKMLPEESFEERLRGLITWFFQNEITKLALEEEKLIGYTCFAGPWDGMFGNVKGVFSPLGASAFGGADRGKTASLLFEALANELVQKQVFQYGYSRYAHDTEVGRSFVMNCFGIRCSDSVLRLADRAALHAKLQSIQSAEQAATAQSSTEQSAATQATTAQSATEQSAAVQIVAAQEAAQEADGKQLQLTDITIRELCGYAEQETALSLMCELVEHLAAGPCFFPEDVEEYKKNWYKPERRMLAAYDGETPVGFIKFANEGENFITESEAMMNINGMYVKKEYRRLGIAELLIEKVCQIVEADGAGYLGVDCETINPTALRFWGKYFENYTYSYVRRVDERILQ